MSDIEDIKPGDLVKAFELDHRTEPFQWAKTPTHIPAKRLVTVYSIELEDPTLRIATSPTPYKNTLN
jgi:hypothetical protein